MINKILKDSDFSINIISKEQFEKRIAGLEKQIAGKSKYENKVMLDYLPKNKEFYVIEDIFQNYEGDCWWEFTIALKYKEMYLTICDSGSN